MIGTAKRFTRFKTDEFKLPVTLNLKDCEIRNERHFIEFLLRNDWIQRQLGIKMGDSNGFFPDIKGEIYGGTGDKISVEVEYSAENYSLHGHAFKGCDLILSFLRRPNVRFIKGIPVWSFYECYGNDKFVSLCLYDDVKFDFSSLEEY